MFRINTNSTDASKTLRWLCSTLPLIILMQSTYKWILDNSYKPEENFALDFKKQWPFIWEVSICWYPNEIKSMQTKICSPFHVWVLVQKSSINWVTKSNRMFKILTWNARNRSTLQYKKIYNVICHVNMLRTNMPWLF